jgi:hypothetical protein
MTRRFGGFKRDMRALVGWLLSHGVSWLVMKRIYWKSVFSHLEATGIPALVVKKNVACGSGRRAVGR